MMDVKAVLFDVFGSCVDWRGSVVDALREFGAARGLAADWEGIADAWRGSYAPSMDRVRQGTQPWTILDDLHRAALDRILDARGLPVADADRVALTRVWHRLRPWPDTVPGLTRLRARAIIGPLSNGHVALQVDLARHALLPWDVVFGADLFRHYKPDPEVYLGAASLLGLRPDQVMMAAAHNGDLHAARACGLRTAFFPRPTEHGPHQTRDVGPDAAWDVVAHDICDLAARLGT